MYIRTYCMLMCVCMTLHVYVRILMYALYVHTDMYCTCEKLQTCTICVQIFAFYSQKPIDWRNSQK